MRKALVAAAVTVAVVAYGGMLVRHASFAVGGADSSGYMNEARLMAAGRISLPIVPLRTLHLGPDWAYVFTPSGFCPRPTERAWCRAIPPDCRLTSPSRR